MEEESPTSESTHFRLCVSEKCASIKLALLLISDFSGYRPWLGEAAPQPECCSVCAQKAPASPGLPWSCPPT